MTFDRSRRRMFMAALGLGAVLVLPVSKSVADEGGRLSTHVLDTLSGKPAGGMKIDFYVSENGAFRLVMQMTTNADGRTDKPVLVGDALKAGSYQFVFHVGEYFKAKGVPQADPPFLDMVPVQFSIADAKAHYHVPLLTTPWSYSTYRGS